MPVVWNDYIINQFSCVAIHCVIQEIRCVMPLLQEMVFSFLKKEEKTKIALHSRYSIGIAKKSS